MGAVRASMGPPVVRSLLLYRWCCCWFCFSFLCNGQVAVFSSFDDVLALDVVLVLLLFNVVVVIVIVVVVVVVVILVVVEVVVVIVVVRSVCFVV